MAAQNSTASNNIKKRKLQSDFDLENVIVHNCCYIEMLPDDIMLHGILQRIPKCYWPIYQYVCKKWHRVARMVISGWTNLHKLKDYKSSKKNFYELGTLGDLKIGDYYVNVMWNERLMHFIKGLCYTHNVDMIGLLKTRIYYNKYTLNYAFRQAVKTGSEPIVKLCMRWGATECFDECLEISAAKGHINIVRLMIKSGATNFDNAMDRAAFNGYMDIVRLMMECGATNIYNAMGNAAFSGHVKIV